MAIVLWIAYGLSAAFSILAFYGLNVMTEPLIAGDSGGGNGNPALIIVVFALPFFMYFIYGTIEMSKRQVEHLNNRTILLISLLVSALISSWILIGTILKAFHFRHSIVEIKENFNTTEELPLLNTFSNFLFFNPLTFLMLLLFCYMIGGLWAFRIGRQP